MTETTKKKTVAKASVGKQVKPSPAKAVLSEAAAKPAVLKAGAGKTSAPKAKVAAKPKAATPAPPASAKRTASPSVTFATNGSRELSAEVVARKAYEIFLSEGHQHGRDQDHWFRAEEELRNVLA